MWIIPMILALGEHAYALITLRISPAVSTLAARQLGDACPGLRLLN